MALHLKEGVRLGGLVPQMAVVLQVASGVWANMGADLVVTSANDSKHSRTSFHYDGRAVDLRTHNLKAPRDALVELKRRLGDNLDIDVVLEGEGTPNEHIHVEWQPKRPADV